MFSATRHDTIIDRLMLGSADSGRMTRLIVQLGLIATGSVLLAASAQFKVTVPLSPVPVTGQTLVVLMIGMAYGPRLGAMTICAYILAGLRGLPVFAGGMAGLPVLAGPSGGYLVGFIAAAFVIGLLAQRGMDRSILMTALAMLVGNLVIYLFGYAWLASLIGMQKAFTFGVWPFLWGDAMKLVVAACLMPAAWRSVKLLGRKLSDGQG